MDFAESDGGQALLARMVIEKKIVFLVAWRVATNPDFSVQEAREES